jgi:hypothetical protein
MGYHYSGPGRQVTAAYNCFGQIDDVKRMRCRRMKSKIRQFTELCAVAVDNKPNLAVNLVSDLRANRANSVLYSVLGVKQTN